VPYRVGSDIGRTGQNFNKINHLFSVGGGKPLEGASHLRYLLGATSLPELKGLFEDGSDI
jgi:hypothetical protein